VEPINVLKSVRIIDYHNTGNTLLLVNNGVSGFGEMNNIAHENQILFIPARKLIPIT
jgi:AraC-like DNA-binding protein